jgi:hypothetical protein
MLRGFTLLGPGLGVALQNILGRRVMPLNWGGYNMCACAIGAAEPGGNTHIFVVSYTLTFPMILDKTIRPGTPPRFKPLHGHMRPSDFSSHFIWRAGGATYDITIAFVGGFDEDGEVFVDAAVKPLVIPARESMHNFELPAQPGVVHVPVRVGAMLDYRIVRAQGRLFLHDAFVSNITELFVWPDRIAMSDARGVRIVNVCPREKPAAEKQNGGGGETARGETARSETARSESARSESARSETARGETARGETARSENREAPYVRLHSKNWSCVGAVQKLRPKGQALRFLDWFYPEGVRTVDVSLPDGMCTSKVRYPRRKGADVVNIDAFNETFPGMSFGSTTAPVAYHDRPGALGVGHFKYRLDHVHRHPFFKHVVSDMRAAFPGRFVCHHTYVYGFFFFLATDKDLLLSDGYVMVPDLPGVKYHSTVFFPKGLTQCPTTGDLLMTGGYTDYYNAVVRVDAEAATAACAHSAKRFDAAEYRFAFMRCQANGCSISERLEPAHTIRDSAGRGTSAPPPPPPREAAPDVQSKRFTGGLSGSRGGSRRRPRTRGLESSGTPR